MEPVNFEISTQDFIINGKKELIICGEIHYFRMDPAAWEPALDKLVQAGCNTVAYYVPWFVHEYQQGCFDFDGSTNPCNNLKHWMRLTQQKGLMAIFRPGPYVYAECTDLGIPGWFTEKYPNAKVKTYKNGEYVDGSTINVVGHNHPDFLAATKSYYKAVAEVLRPNLAPAGNVIMVQLCNEIPADDHSDHNPENLGIGSPEGRYPRYLKGKYQNLEKLNGLYKTDFAAFETVQPHMLEAANPEIAKLDKLEFYYNHYYPDYFATLRGFMLENGIHSNFCHNAYNPRAISLHVENRRKNPWLNIGLDCYFSLKGSLNLKDLSYYCEYGAEYSSKFLGGVPFVLEQESGYWNDYPILYGPELYLWNIWAIASGYRGFNMYMFASAENRPGMGFYGTSHNWQAPLDKEGRPRPSYPWIEKSITDIKNHQQALVQPLCYDIALGLKSDPGLIWKPVAKACDETYFALRSEGYTPEIIDVFAGDSWAGRPALVMVADECMDAENQQKLAAYVLGGGKLLLTGALPFLAMDGRPCTILADALGVKTGPKPTDPPNQQIIKLEGREYYTGAAIQPVTPGQNARLLATGRAGEDAVFCISAGKGTAITAPFDVNIVMRDSAALLRLLLQKLGAEPAVKGCGMLKILVKTGGTALVINPHPVEIEEQTEINGRPYLLKLAPYEFTTLDLEN